LSVSNHHPPLKLCIMIVIRQDLWSVLTECNLAVEKSENCQVFGFWTHDSSLRAMEHKSRPKPHDSVINIVLLNPCCSSIKQYHSCFYCWSPYTRMTFLLLWMFFNHGYSICNKITAI
jgi:hypothetical protein